uniref:Uncharacterized protein n=1 Tax=Cacopsylla melanoneura TaxID=428564 RepID=A0A8D8Z5C3_9HEMI
MCVVFSINSFNNLCVILVPHLHLLFKMETHFLSISPSLSLLTIPCFLYFVSYSLFPFHLLLSISPSLFLPPPFSLSSSFPLSLFLLSFPLSSTFPLSSSFPLY